MLRSERSLNEQEKEIIERINKSYSRGNNPNIDVNQLISCSFCDFDAEEFFSNPSPEKLANCFSESETEKYFIQVDGKKELLLTVRKMKDKWQMYTKERWDEQSLPLRKMLHEAGTSRYSIFKYGFDRFVMYDTPEGIAYCTTDGRKISSEGICELLVTFINRKKDPFFDKIKMIEKEKEEKKNKIFELLEKKYSKQTSRSDDPTDIGLQFGCTGEDCSIHVPMQSFYDWCTFAVGEWWINGTISQCNLATNWIIIRTGGYNNCCSLSPTNVNPGSPVYQSCVINNSIQIEQVPPFLSRYKFVPGQIKPFADLLLALLEDGIIYSPRLRCIGWIYSTNISRAHTIIIGGVKITELDVRSHKFTCTVYYGDPHSGYYSETECNQDQIFGDTEGILAMVE